MKTPRGYEGRRLQKTGGSTYVVSIPKSWISSNKLGKGDLVYFLPRPDGSLSVYTDETPKIEKGRKICEVTNDMPTEHLFRLLVAEYIAGFPLIEVRTTGRMSAGTREVVREFAQRVIGPEILEETAEMVVLQDMVSSNPLPLPSVIRRMHPMAHAMQKDAMTAFATLDTSIAEDVKDRDREVDRLHWFVNKTVVTALMDPRTLASLNLTLPDCLTYLTASRQLERISDHAVRIAEVTEWIEESTLPKGSVEELSALSVSALEFLDQSIASIFDGDIEKANKVIDGVNEVVATRNKSLKEIFTRKGRMAVALAYVLESLERTCLYASDIAEIALNHAIAKEAKP
jgi:phosphate uptake regulator